MAANEYKTLIYEKRGNYAAITLNRPEVLNALSSQMLTDILAVLEEIEHDSEIRAFLFTGSGSKSFVSGADINELNGISAVEGLRFMEFGQYVFNRIEASPKPSIAAVNGYALGGGCELAMCCDIRIASENAKFGQPEITLGNIPGWGGTQRLPRLIGRNRASEMIFTGTFIKADKAERWGLVNRVVPQADLLAEAETLIARIASMSPTALKMAKEAIAGGLASTVEVGLHIEAHGVCICLGTEDQTEGVNAFLEKRTPVFVGK